MPLHCSLSSKSGPPLQFSFKDFRSIQSVQQYHGVSITYRRSAYPGRAPQCWGTFHCWWRNSGYNCWLLNFGYWMFQLVLPRYLQYGGLTIYTNRRHTEQLLYIRLHPVEVYYLTPAGISTVHNPVDGRSEDLDHFERPLPRSVQKNQLDSVEKQVNNTVWFPLDVSIVRLLMSLLHRHMLIDLFISQLQSILKHISVLNGVVISSGWNREQYIFR